MATSPIQAGFVPADADANPWFDRINEMLTDYEATVEDAITASDPMLALRFARMMQSYERDLVQMGVIVSGKIGRA